MTNATLAGNSHAVASTDLRVLDPHVAPMRPANDCPFADHVHLDRGTRLGAALQHDGRWYSAFKAAHGSASSNVSFVRARLRARAAAARRAYTRVATQRTATHHCCGAPPLLWCSGGDRHNVSVRVRTKSPTNVARAERGGRGGPWRR